MNVYNDQAKALKTSRDGGVSTSNRTGTSTLGPRTKSTVNVGDKKTSTNKSFIDKHPVEDSKTKDTREPKTPRGKQSIKETTETTKGLGARTKTTTNLPVTPVNRPSKHHTAADTTSKYIILTTLFRRRYNQKRT